MRMPSDPVSVTTTTATGKPTATNGPISSLILPSSLVPYIWPSSPASFCTGVVVGLLVAFLRPMIEFYVDIGASYISIAMRYILIWGSVAFIAWAILRTLQQTSAATLVINPENEKYNQEQFLGSPNISNDQEFHSSFLKQNSNKLLLKPQCIFQTLLLLDDSYFRINHTILITKSSFQISLQSFKCMMTNQKLNTYTNALGLDLLIAIPQAITAVP